MEEARGPMVKPRVSPICNFPSHETIGANYGRNRSNRVAIMGDATYQVPPSNPGARCHLPGVPPSRCHLVAGAEQRHILAVKKMLSLWRDHSLNIFEVHADHHSCRLFEEFRANKGGTLWVP